MVHGPFSLELIEAMALSGVFPSDVPVCREGTQEWHPLSRNNQPGQPCGPCPLTGSTVLIGSLVTALLILGACLFIRSRSEAQRTPAQPAVAHNTNSPTPTLSTPSYTPPPSLHDDIQRVLATVR